METNNDKFKLSLESSFEQQLFESFRDLSINSATTSNIENYPIAIGTHPGNVRQRNEDRIAVAHISSKNGSSYTLAIVCDGVGGSSYGDMAASLAVTFFITELLVLTEKNNLKLIVDSILRKIDNRVREILKGEGTTTLSAILANSEDFIAVNIGDSRIFSWDFKNNKAFQVSEDDTLENEFKKNNIKDLAALKIHNINNTLSQALGEKDRSSEQLEVNLFLSNNFECGIVLATDGAWKDTGNSFLSLLKQAPSCLDAVRRVLATATWCGGRDNITMLAIEDAKTLQKISLAEARDFSEFNWITVWVKNSKLKIACPIYKTSTEKPKESYNILTEKPKAKAKNAPQNPRTKNKSPIKNKTQKNGDLEKINYEIIIEQGEEKKPEENDE
ncbi:PP2C family protein-serine/threonine phosphatase [Yersinia enterocolitica]|uniref:PP2C family protein-serine/threonine phosphatase n=1 Tax=Yersinia enterocolitica TaxID=630 RepID=UPI003D0501C5